MVLDSDMAEVVWIKPILEVVRFKWDAVIDLKQKFMGLAVMVRDYKGGPLAAMHSQIPFIIEPKVVKTLAL